MSDTTATATPASAASAAAAAAKQKTPFKWLVTNNPQLQKDVIDFCNSHGVDEAAEKWNVSPATVYSVLRSVGAYEPTKRPVYDNDPAKLEKAKELLSSGRRATVVAKELGLSISSVYGVARQHNITLQKGIEAKPIPQSTLDLIQNGLKGGRSAKSLSNETGVAYVKVLDMAEKWGISLERKGKGGRAIFGQKPSA